MLVVDRQEGLVHGLCGMMMSVEKIQSIAEAARAFEGRQFDASGGVTGPMHHALSVYAKRVESIRHLKVCQDLSWSVLQE